MTRRRRIHLPIAALALLSALLSPTAGPVRAAPLGPLDCAAPGDDRCERWATSYDDPEFYTNADPATIWTTNDHLKKMVVSPTGDRVFALGLSTGFAVGRWSLVATNAVSGDRLWVASRELQFPPPGVCVTMHCTPRMVDIAVSPDGKRVYLTGSVQVFERPGDQYPLINTDVLTAAYRASTGEKLWERTWSARPVGHREGLEFSMHSEDAGLAIAPSPTGDRVYVTGWTHATKGLYDVLVLGYDAATGEERWVSTYDTSTAESPYTTDEAIPSLATVSSDGRALYLGAARCPSLRFGDPCQYMVMAYQAHDPAAPSSDGRLLWSRQIGQGPYALPFFEPPVTSPLTVTGSPSALGVAPDGSRLYVTGFRDITGASNTHTTAALDPATGEQIWAAKFGTGGIRPIFIAPRPQGDRIYVGGSPQVISYDAATGQQVSTLSAGTYAGAALSPAGDRLYVIGTPANFTIVEPRQQVTAYDTTSLSRVWVAQYQSLHEQEGGRFVAVAPDGRVYTGGDLLRIVENQASGMVPTKNRMDWGLQSYEP